MRNSRLVFAIPLSLLALGVVALAPTPADAGPVVAKPSAFKGKANDPKSCGNPYPAGAAIVTAAWLPGIGLPDNDGDNFNPVNPADVPNTKDPRQGLLLSKNGATVACSAAGANILQLGPLTAVENMELGFDYRGGSHCGGGAPRFNVSWKFEGEDGFSFVGGCSADPVAEAAPQDPTWTRVRLNLQDPSQAFPIVPVGAKITGISIVFDEGTDTGGGMPGLAVIDNIYINGILIRKGTGTAH